VYPQTKQLPYQPLKTLGADDTAIVWGTGTSGTSDNVSEKDSTVEVVDIPQLANAGIVIFHGYHATAPNDKTLTWMLVGWREKGPAEYIANGTATLGTQRVDSDTSTETYADTIAISAQKWLKPLYIKDSASNRVAKLVFDLCGLSHIAAVIQKGTATTTGAKISFF